MSEVFKAYKKAHRVRFAVFTKPYNVNDTESREDLLKRIYELESKNKEYEETIKDLRNTIEELESQLIDDIVRTVDINVTIDGYENDNYEEEQGDTYE